ncbi:hypothetical protein MsAm2_05910 [Methanolapillus ohkumae]|uniref:Uncharacterized protein n=2 Tax=Methanolapillus ohkumae TaxID=3028298 RepID=A0AA96ZWQ2_9EURY|nr:hypothetical protein MsAm2_05910 [Methanosarcinaceae archaeon Am2]
MGLFDKLLGKKNKKIAPLDWKLDAESKNHKDYISSSEYTIPSDKIMSGLIRDMESGSCFSSENIFFRVDFMGKENEWYKKRDYLVQNLILQKKTAEPAESAELRQEPEHKTGDGNETVSESKNEMVSGSKVDTTTGFYKSPEPGTSVFVLEGDGVFVKENNSGLICDTEETDCHFYAEFVYDNQSLYILKCKGFDQTDNWYAFMFLFKLIEYYYKPDGESRTVKKEKCEK